MQTYLEYYNAMLRPQLTKIDLFLKTEPQPYSLTETAKLLELSKKELTALLERLSVCCITRPVFLYLMANGSSALCQFFARQLSHDASCYFPKDIAFIYHLEERQIAQVFDEMGLRCCTDGFLPYLFARILMPDKQYQS